MTLTPYQRWQKRTKDGRKMAAGWTSAKYDPPKVGQYEVRGHHKHCYLTWAYGAWWHQSVGDDYAGMSGSWHRQKGSWDWRPSSWGHCTVNWGSVIHQAAEGGNDQAKQDIEKAVREYDERVSKRV